MQGELMVRGTRRYLWAVATVTLLLGMSASAEDPALVAANTAKGPVKAPVYQSAQSISAAKAETSGEAKAPVKAPAKGVSAAGSVPVPGIPKNYRTFVHIQRYTMEQNGDGVGTPISNVRIEIQFPGSKTKIQLPEGGQFWPIGNGQVQEINRTFEIPYAFIEKDGFRFIIQMFRKGSEMLPCNFDVTQLSVFNRAYVCHTDIAWQTQNLRVKEELLDKEGVQVRIFTDLNSKPNEIPTDAVALK